MQFDRFPPSKERRSLTASLGPPERLIAVQIFAAGFLKPLLVFSAAFIVRAEIVSAVLNEFVAQFFALRAAGALETYDDEK